MPDDEYHVTTNRRSDWDFTVITKEVGIPIDESPENYNIQGGVRVYTGMSDIAPRYKAILREDTMQVFYIGSQQYQPIPHRLVLAPIIHGMPGIQMHIKSVNHGAKIFADFLDPRIIVIGGENYRGGIRLVNSLDGTFRLTIEGILYRVRTNSVLMLSEFLSSFERRHIIGNYEAEDFARIARETLETVVQRISNLQSLTTVNVTDVAFRQLVERMELPQKYKKLAYEIWETPEIVELPSTGTAWAVLNILAYLVTHEVSRNLNDEAVYRLQMNMDKVLARHLLPSTPRRELPQPTTPSFPPGPTPQEHPPLAVPQAVPRTNDTPPRPVVRSKSENLDDLLDKLERDLH